MMSPVATDFSDDSVLVPALRAGDDEAFTWLVDRYDAALRRLARHYVSTQAVADEVVQETWLAVLQGIDRFERRSSLKTWIFRILMNKARTRGVREHRSVPVSSLGPDDADTAGFGLEWFRPAEDPEAAGHWATLPARWDEQPQGRVESQETLDRVQDSIAALPVNLRQVLVLRDVEGWSSEEVCDVLSLSPSNQRVLLHRARAKVRKDLTDLFEPVAS
jgi:RNA polymerase sigma-70 factor (ECF subfamily)